MKKLFGTDGIRGIANEELTADLAFKVGYAAAVVLRKEISKNPKILIGTDTRVSAAMLEAAITAGANSAGADVFTVGVMPTPAVAYLTRFYSCDAGIVISASHNSYEFNGLKIFSHRGYKLQDELEAQIEAEVNAYDSAKRVNSSTNIGRRIEKRNGADDYLRHLVGSLGLSLEGQKIALDCANGAAYQIGPELFRKLGAEVITIGVEPNGFNINQDCGSTAPQRLIEAVLNSGADLGLAFDGDADRLLAIDETGRLVDGDGILMILAADMKAQGKLLKNGAVATVMSNFGLDEFMRKKQIDLLKTDVGDRNVLESMLEEGYILGGEQSGHIILLDHATTGDGMVSALSLLGALQRSGERLAIAREHWRIYPQVLINVRIPNDLKQKVMSDPSIQEQIQEFSETLGERGRILVRPSGTEPKVRIMLEGEAKDEIQRMAEFLANLISSRYGI
ncbi:MAG: phosphoglucosamine mutase [Eubacteriales bacterium]|nr:phosphoglucosamine mutase [Eubacteriales bacterium]